MRKLYLLLMLVLLVGKMSQAKSRTVREKNLQVNTHEFKYPSISLPERTTFDFEIIMPYSMRGIPASQFLTTEMYLEGWDRVYRQPSMLLSLYLDEPFMSPAELCTRYEVSEDSITTDKGDRILIRDTTWYYQYKVTLQGKGKLEATDPMGRVMFYEYTPNFCTERMSREYLSKREAQRDLRYNSDLYRRDMLLEWYGEQVHRAQDLAYTRVSYYERPVQKQLKQIGNRKHKEYAQYNSNVNQVATILSQYRPTLNKDHTYRELTPYLRYFDDLAEKYKVGKRRDRKMRYISLYNKFLVQSILDNHSQAVNTLYMLESTGINKYASRIKANSEREELRIRQLNDWNF